VTSTLASRLAASKDRPVDSEIPLPSTRVVILLDDITPHQTPDTVAAELPSKSADEVQSAKVTSEEEDLDILEIEGYEFFDV
jgi:hypothetical protein